jgi:hypothetical protein
MLHLYLDRIFITMDQSIGVLFLLVKGYLASKSRDWRCDWEGKVGQRHLLSEISSPQQGRTSSDSPYKKILIRNRSAMKWKGIAPLGISPEELEKALETSRMVYR